MNIRMDKQLQRKLKQSIRNETGNGMHIHFDRKVFGTDITHLLDNNLPFSDKAAKMLTMIFRNETHTNGYCKFAKNYRDHYN